MGKRVELTGDDSPVLRFIREGKGNTSSGNILGAGKTSLGMAKVGGRGGGSSITFPLLPPSFLFPDINSPCCPGLTLAVVPAEIIVSITTFYY